MATPIDTHNGIDNGIHNGKDEKQYLEQRPSAATDLDNVDVMSRVGLSRKLMFASLISYIGGKSLVFIHIKSLILEPTAYNFGVRRLPKVWQI